MSTRRRENVVQARSFSKMLEQTLRRYQNRAIEAAQVIKEGVAFCDALETNDSAVQALGDETPRGIARELVETVRNNVTIDWTLRENVRANLRRLVCRILRKYGSPLYKQ